MINFAFIDSKKEINNVIIYKSVLDLFKELDYNFELEEEEEVYQFYIFENIDVITKEKTEPICIGRVSISTFNDKKEMHIEIHYDEIDSNIDSVAFKTVYSLKENLKSLFRGYWNECVWLEDSQSQIFAEKLYANTYKVENKLRTFINLLMMRRKGIKWWESYVANKVSQTSKERAGAYRRIAPLYKNVDTKLLSIDTNHLKDIMVYKQQIWEPSYDSQIEEWIKSSEESDMRRVRERLLKEQFQVKVDLWNDVFSNYFTEDFKKIWDEFSKNRNHIAHNKLIDFVAYRTMLKNIEEVSSAIEEADHRFKQTDKSSEEQEKLSRLYIENEIEYAKVEAGVEIYDDEIIHDMFDEDVSTMVNEINDSLYFRSDIEVNDETSHIIPNKDGVLSINSKLSDIYTIEIFVDQYLIDNSPGGLSESSVHIYLINKEDLSKEIESYPFSFVNGEYVYNYEQGNYMPETYEEFYGIHINSVINKIEELVENYFPDKLRELEEWLRAESLDGGPKVVGEFHCEECGEQTVSIHNEFYDFGKCVTCGHLQESDIEKCIRCEEYTNDLSVMELCEVCQERFESE